MNQGENRGFGGDDLLNLERQLQGGWKKQEAPKQQLPPQTPQQPPQQESYTAPKLTPEEQELADKLKEVEGLPRRTKEERAIRVKRVEEILKLSQREFARLYQVCYLGSKDEHPDGHHIAVQRGKEARVSPEIIPIGLAEDILGNELLPCYYHYVGFLTGATATGKPHEILPFNPQPELEKIVEATTQEYRIVNRQNPQRNYKLKLEEDLVTAVIFKDKKFYADSIARQPVVNYLQGVNNAIQSVKNGQITRDELAAIIRNWVSREIITAQVTQEAVTVAETQKPAEKIILAGVYEIEYVPSSLERMEDINLMLNNLGHMLKTPFSLLYTKEGERAKVSLGREATREYFNGIAPLTQRLDAIIGMWRNDPTKGKEVMDNIYQAFGAFGQQQQ